MNERGSLLIGLLFAGAILATLLITVTFALPRYTNVPGLSGTGGEDNNGANVSGSPTSVIKQAESVKLRADLKSLSTQMMVYFVENNAYPNSLQELISYGGLSADVAGIRYIRCSDTAAVFYHDSSGYPGYTFQYDNVGAYSGDSPPSCV